MGGNVFKDKGGSLTTTIDKENVGSTLDHFRRAVLTPLSVATYERIGSAGKKSKSGDLDIVISHGDSDSKVFKDQFTKGVKNLIGSQRVKQIGSLVCVMYPIVDTGGNVTDESVQIDIVISTDTGHVSWLMSGGGDEKSVKGVYRNLLLSHVANIRSQELSEEGVETKITISFPGGASVKRGGKTVISGVTEPGRILGLLGLDVRPTTSATFEELVTLLSSSRRTSHYLSGFPTYIEKYTKSDPEGAQVAIDFIRSHTNLTEVIRNLIYSSMGVL